MKVNIDEIQKIAFLLFAKLKESNGVEIELKSDYYWCFVEEEIYNPYDDPKNLTLGQLSDDLNELHNSLLSDDLVSYDLRRLARILEALSIENPIAF